MKLKLRLLEKSKAQAWYRTGDLDQFDILGEDLNTNNAAGRAAGAGPVWMWRPAKATRDWTDDMHPFTTKAACVADLEAHIAAGLTQQVSADMQADLGAVCPMCGGVGAECPFPGTHAAQVAPPPPPPPATIIVRCDCGQLNRMLVTLPPGKTVRCGACHVDISDLDETSNNADYV